MTMAVCVSLWVSLSSPSLSPREEPCLLLHLFFMVSVLHSYHVNLGGLLGINHVHNKY